MSAATPDYERVCSVCLRPMQVTAAGVIRVHGPIRSRCPGSHLPPRVSTSQASMPTSAGPPSDSPSEDLPRPEPPISVLHHPLLPSEFPVSSLKTLKHIPQAAREHAARKLAAILDFVTVHNSPEITLTKFRRNTPSHGSHLVIEALSRTL